MVVNGIGTRTMLVQTANAIVTDLSYWYLFVYLDVLLKSTGALILVPAVSTIVHLLCQQTIEQLLSNARPDIVEPLSPIYLRSATINHNLTDHKIKKGEPNA